MEADNFTRHYDVIRKRVRYFFPRASSADVVQEAYIEALRYARSSRRPVENPKALLWTIAKRTAMRRGFTNVYDKPGFDYRVRGPPEAVLEPWLEAADRESHENILRLVADLEPLQAQAIRGHYFEGKSCTQLARDYGVNRSTIKSRLRRARKTLREAMGRSDE